MGLYGAPWLQPVATGRKSDGLRNRRNRRKPFAASCDRLPFGAHGKEGVDGSSPSEGFAKDQQKGLFLSPRLDDLQRGVSMELMELSDSEAPHAERAAVMDDFAAQFVVPGFVAVDPA
jgi:hypothetical protein